MLRHIVTALTATAALGAAVIFPTPSSAYFFPPYPIPQGHVRVGSPGGTFHPVLVCRHSWHNGHPFDCHIVAVSSGRAN
jgi:hypothetical protein